MEQAFTLIELLIVMSIVSLLAAIAVPQFEEYKKRAYDTRAVSDLKNIATAEEAYFIDNESYLSCLDAECEALPGIGVLSKGVTAEMVAEEITFTGSASHPNGTGKVFRWDSERGGLVE